MGSQIGHDWATELQTWAVWYVLQSPISLLWNEDDNRIYFNLFWGDEISICKLLKNCLVDSENFMNISYYYPFFSPLLHMKKTKLTKSEWQQAWCWKPAIFFLWPCHLACRILVPWPGTELGPQKWKCQVLTNGLSGNSQKTSYLDSHLLALSLRSFSFRSRFSSLLIVLH